MDIYKLAHYLYTNKSFATHTTKKKTFFVQHDIQKCLNSYKMDDFFHYNKLSKKKTAPTISTNAYSNKVSCTNLYRKMQNKV